MRGRLTKLYFSRAELCLAEQRPHEFVNSIWPTLIISFGPPKAPLTPRLLPFLVTPVVAKPCAAPFAARLGRSGGRGYQQQALRKWGLAHALPDRTRDRVRWLRGPAFLPDTPRTKFVPSPVLLDTPPPQTGSRSSEPASDQAPDSANTLRHTRSGAPLEKPTPDPR